MLIGAQTSDAPRREQVQAIKTERKKIVDLALSRPDLEMAPPPLVTF